MCAQDLKTLKKHYETSVGEPHLPSYWAMSYTAALEKSHLALISSTKWTANFAEQQRLESPLGQQN